MNKKQINRKKYEESKLQKIIFNDDLGDYNY